MYTANSRKDVAKKKKKRGYSLFGGTKPLPYGFPTGIPFESWLERFYRPTDYFGGDRCAVYRQLVRSGPRYDPLRDPLHMHPAFRYALVGVANDFGWTMRRAFYDGGWPRCGGGDYRTTASSTVRFVPSLLHTPHFDHYDQDDERKERSRRVRIVRKSVDALYDNDHVCGLKNSWKSTFRALVDQAITSFATAVSISIESVCRLEHVRRSPPSIEQDASRAQDPNTALIACVGALRNIEFFSERCPGFFAIVAEQASNDVQTRMRSSSFAFHGGARNGVLYATRAVIYEHVCRLRATPAFFEGLAIRCAAIFKGMEHDSGASILGALGLFASCVRSWYDYETDADVLAVLIERHIDLYKEDSGISWILKRRSETGFKGKKARIALLSWTVFVGRRFSKRQKASMWMS